MGEQLSLPERLVLPRAVCLWLWGQLPCRLRTCWMVAAAALVPAVAGPSAGAESCWEKHLAPVRHFHRGSSGGAAAGQGTN